MEPMWRMFRYSLTLIEKMSSNIVANRSATALRARLQELTGKSLFNRALIVQFTDESLP